MCLARVEAHWVQNGTLMSHKTPPFKYVEPSRHAGLREEQPTAAPLPFLPSGAATPARGSLD